MLKNEANIKTNKIALGKLFRRGRVDEDHQGTSSHSNTVQLDRDLYKTLTAKQDLTKYVTVVPTLERAAGRYPYVDISNAALTSQPELELGQPVPNIGVESVSFEHVTYRGDLFISAELIQDLEDSLDLDAGEIIAQEVKQIDVNTKSREIIEAMKLATPAAVADTAELLSLINTFGSAYDVKVFASASLYDSLDQSGLIDYQLEYPRFKGKEVIKIDDAKIVGDVAGAKVAFVGDAAEYLFLFDRQFITVDNLKHNIGISATVSTRFDVKEANAVAGKFVTMA